MSPAGRGERKDRRGRIASIAPLKAGPPLLRTLPLLTTMVLVGAVLLGSALTAPGSLWAANEGVQYRQATAAFNRAAKTPGTRPAVWRGIAGRFQTIYRTTPKSRRGAYALYSAALSYKEAWRSSKDWKDLSRAVSRFRRFAEVFSRNPLADDALMHLAELLVTGYYDAVGALKAIRLVVKNYPNGDQAPAARKQVAVLDAAVAAQKPAARPSGSKARFFRKVSTRNPAVTPRKEKHAKTVNTARPARPQNEKRAKIANKARLAKPKLEKRAKTGNTAQIVRRKLQKRGKTVAAANPARPSMHRPGQNSTLRPLDPTRVPSVVFTRETPRKPAGSQKVMPGRPWRVKRVQIWSTLEVTRVILTTDPAVTFRSGRLGRTLKKPERLFFDLPATLPGKDVAPVYPLDDGVLTRIRIGSLTGNKTRVVFDFNRVRRYEVKNFLLPSERKIVIDLYPPKPSRIARERRGETGTADRGVGKKPDGPPATLSLKSSLGLKVRSIMLDPGHGGRDPGAIAYGLQEKNVALVIAKRLKVLFKRDNPKLRVGMTREKDRYIPLQRRPALAKRFGADLFVSIHLNANPKEGFQGIETYFLNLTRNASALTVAARENATTQKRISDLNNILVDLLRDTNIVESSQLALRLHSSLVDSLKSHTPIRDLGVKQAPFLVLMGAEMPSVLVEAGFLTNRKENRRLKTRAYLNRIAEGIHAGLQNYIENQNLSAKTPPLPRIAGGPRL